MSLHNWPPHNLLLIGCVWSCNRMRPLSLLVVDRRLRFYYLLGRLAVLNGWLLITVAGPLGWSEVTGGKWLEIQNLVLVLIKRSCNWAASSSVLRIQGQHTWYRFVQIVTIFISKFLQKMIQSLSPQFPRVSLIDRVTILKSSTWQNSKPNTKNFCKWWINMGRIWTLLNKIIVDLLRC